MIKTIKHKGLRKLWEKDDASALPAQQVDKIRRILETLDTMKTLDILKAIPGYRFHSLTGNLKGHYSVTVTGNYRITFMYEDQDVYVVDYQDYH